MDNTEGNIKSPITTPKIIMEARNLPENEGEKLIIETIKQSFSECFECSCNESDFIQLGGYNNKNYKVIIGSKSYFAKLENQEPSIVGSSLQNEITCMRLVQDAHLCPSLVFFDSKRSVMIREFIEEDFNFELPKAKKKYIELLKRLHNLDIQFPNVFHPIKVLRKYEEIAQSRNVELPLILVKNLLPKVYTFNEDELFTRTAPCHLDPQFANVISGGDQLYFIDWEFSAMSEPLFDLASMCASEEFSYQEMRDILTLYLERSPSEEEWGRFNKIRVIADLRMCLFCLLYTSIAKDKTSVYQNFANIFLKSATDNLNVGFSPSDSEELTR